MIHKFIFFVTIFLVATTVSYCRPCNINIVINVFSLVTDKKYSYTIQERDIHGTAFNIRISDNVHLHGNILDCRGALTFTLVDSANDIQIDGQFVNGLDTLKEQALEVDVIKSTEKIVISRYFEPIADGIWIHKNIKGEVLRKQEYHDGISE